jgi:hypothetical protein
MQAFGCRTDGPQGALATPASRPAESPISEALASVTVPATEGVEARDAAASASLRGLLREQLMAAKTAARLAA